MAKKRQIKLQNFISLFVISGSLLLAVGLLVWCRSAANDPQAVLEGMIENSLRTRSVTKQTVQDDGFQKLNQIVRLQTAGVNAANSKTILSQSGANGATVKTESIGTPTTDYVRYTEITTSQTNIQGQALNFSSLLGIWGKTETQDGTTSGELFSESSLGVVPFGYMAPDERDLIMNIIRDRNVYKTDYSKVERKIENGRPQYTYDVQVEPESYVVMLKAFGKSIGLKQLESLDPSQFKNAPPLQFRLTVDVRSRQLVKTVFVSSSREETYGGYGVRAPVIIPTETITVEELQSRLQSVQ